MIDPKKEKYTDEQLIAMRSYLWELAQLNAQLFLSIKEKESFTKKAAE